jgi:uncharacterized protein (TIGR02246 family)
MRHYAIFGGILILLGLLGADTPPQPPAKAAAEKPAAARTSRAEDEKAIRQVVEQFTKAYNAGDAAAVAKLFAPDAEMADDEGRGAQGRESIQEIFANLFKEHPKTHIEIEIESIRFVGTAVAIEDGMTTVVHAADESASRSRYEVVHVKQDGKWQMASARDLPDEPLSGEEQLRQLEWLVGVWVDESSESLIVTNYHWSDNRQFIVGEFQVQIKGRPAMSGSHRIGWDPAEQKIRSWVFDSEGGFGQGLWTRKENSWIVKMTGVTRDGKTASSTNVTTKVSKDRMIWLSRDRIVGDEVLPDIEEIPIVRKPPQPK